MCAVYFAWLQRNELNLVVRFWGDVFASSRFNLYSTGIQQMMVKAFEVDNETKRRISLVVKFRSE